MNKKIKFSLFVFVFLAGFVVSSCKNSGTTSSESDKKAEQVSKVEYTCPMHPDVISDKPGQCPECGMDLVKVEPDSAAVHMEHME